MFNNDFDPDNLWIATDLSPQITGLPVSLYLFNEAFGNNKTPRLSIIPDTRNHKYDFMEHLLISISDTPKILAKKYTKFNITGSQLVEVFNWIKTNKKVLIDYWFEKIDYVALKKKLILFESPNIPKNIEVKISERVFKKVIDWIELNRDLIIEYWFNKEMTTEQFISKIKHK